MLRMILFCLALALLAGCKKEEGGRVDIYLLQSFTSRIDTTTVPATHAIEGAVLEAEPLVADSDIRYYKKSTATFKLRKDIRPVVKDYGPDRAFAVTVDGEVVYYGRFHPAYMSSIVYGLATIDPVLLRDNEFSIQYVQLEGSPALQQLDRRNDSRIIQALKASGRLR